MGAVRRQGSDGFDALGLGDGEVFHHTGGVDLQDGEFFDLVVATAGDSVPTPAFIAFGGGQERPSPGT
ncbi:hypothetical protein A6A08_24820 [Nocardiopsis sp. TSRI0078]|nr:hypothetical protein A6A08_24820 [Nocardiopsis sp. TSRI0078]